MTIDLAALPPEISSILVYSGPGSTPLVTAASAWNGLAAELSSAAIGYENVVTQLTTEEWLGPASTAAADAVAPYVAWVTNTAAQAEQAASQAGSAAAAFETVLASVVPPEAVLTNRAELTQLLSTNVLGQNTQLIQEVESQYGQFWAQNASALYSYASASASAAQLPKFSAAPQVANPAAALTQGTAAVSVNSIQQQLNKLISQFAKQLGQLAGPLYAPIAIENSFPELRHWSAVVRVEIPVRHEHVPQQPLRLPDRLLAICKLHLLHRGFAELQHRYRQLPDSDRQDHGSARRRCGQCRGRHSEGRARAGRGARQRRGARGGVAGHCTLGRAPVSSGVLERGAAGGTRRSNRDTGQQHPGGSRRRTGKPPGWHAAGRYGGRRPLRQRAPLRIPAHRHVPPDPPRDEAASCRHRELRQTRRSRP